jgi:hypothetical protein
MWGRGATPGLARSGRTETGAATSFFGMPDAKPLLKIVGAECAPVA